MGCDIHMCVEYRPNSEEKWRSGDYFHSNDPTKPLTGRRRVDLYNDRDYELFAVLAGVRGYREEGCIDDPRGLPDDVTDYVRESYEYWGNDAHSASFFTLQELIDFDTEHQPADFIGCYILDPLIRRLKQRADELNVVYDFEWKDVHNREHLRKKANNIRIVFWFDN